MDFFGLFRKDYIIGLDIGASSIKIAQFKALEDGSLFLVKADLKEIAPAADGSVEEKEMLSCLRYLFRGVDAKKARIIVTFNCQQTAIKKVTAPYMPKSELREGIILESKNYFPFSIDTCTLDFEVLGDIVEKGIRRYEILVGVCPTDIVNKYLAALEKAGIRPASIISSSYALQKFAINSASGSDGIKCFIDIGKSHTELILCKGSSLVFCRKIPVCGDDFTKAMTSALVSDKGRIQLSTEEAEKLKRDVGMPSDADTRIIDNKIPAQQVLAMLRTPAEHLANEISRCFDYYREDPSSGRIDSVMIFGGGSSLSGLAKFLSESLGIEVHMGDPIEGLKSDKDAVRERGKTAHRLELAVGAALSMAKGINLLPPEIKDQAKLVIRRGTIEAAISAAVIISILLFIGMKIKIDNFDKRIAVAKLELSSIQPELRKAQAKKMANLVLVEEPYWEDLFNELGSIIPDAIRIDRLSMNNGVIYMKGIVASPDGQQIIADFILKMEKGLFRNVKLVESNDLSDNAGIEFELKCWLDLKQ